VSGGTTRERAKEHSCSITKSLQKDSGSPTSSLKEGLKLNTTKEIGKTEVLTVKEYTNSWTEAATEESGATARSMDMESICIPMETLMRALSSTDSNTERESIGTVLGSYMKDNTALISNRVRVECDSRMATNTLESGRETSLMAREAILLTREKH
jgi:hypothetical protein